MMDLMGQVKNTALNLKTYYINNQLSTNPRTIPNDFFSYAKAFASELIEKYK